MCASDLLSDWAGLGLRADGQRHRHHGAAPGSGLHQNAVIFAIAQADAAADVFQADAAEGFVFAADVVVEQADSVLLHALAVVGDAQHQIFAVAVAEHLHLPASLERGDAVIQGVFHDGL